LYVHTDSGGGVVGDAEAAADSEHGEQDEVPGVLLAILEHGNMTAQTKQTTEHCGHIGTKVFFRSSKGHGCAHVGMIFEGKRS
jgi:hypothetical protein